MIAIMKNDTFYIPFIWHLLIYFIQEGICSKTIYNVNEDERLVSTQYRNLRCKMIVEIILRFTLNHFTLISKAKLPYIKNKASTQFLWNW